MHINEALNGLQFCLKAHYFEGCAKHDKAYLHLCKRRLTDEVLAWSDQST